MRQLFILALIPGLVVGPQVRAGNDDLGQILLLDPIAAVLDENCPVDPVLECETPVQMTRRIVPRTTYKTVTKTILVPQTVMETRDVRSVEYRDEVRERSYTVYEQVPETRQVTTQHTVMVPETRQRTEAFTVQVPFEREVPQTYTVEKLHTETRTGTRQICRCVPKTEMRTTVSGGEVIKRSVDSPNGGVKVQTVVVGGTKTQEPVTVMRKQTVQQTYTYNVSVPRSETLTRMVKQTDYRHETRTREVPEVIQVPKIETRTHNVTEMKSVPRQKTDTYTERVPHIVTKQIQIPVTKSIPQQVTEQIPVTTYDIIEEPVSDCVNCDDPAPSTNLVVPQSQPRSIQSIPSPPREDDAR
jgi:hypothetical protein